MIDNNTDWTSNIKNFLNQKIQEEKISVSELARLTEIPSTTMREMLNNRRPEMKNIVKIADYFNCSIDQILFNKTPSQESQERPQHTKLSLQKLSSNLKRFVTNKLQKNNINQYHLGQRIGHSDDVVRRFLRPDNNDEKMLSTDVIVALAKYFNTNIDQMLGRSSNITKQQELGKEATKISDETIKEAKNIGKTVTGTITSSSQGSNKVSPKKSFVESLTKRSITNSTKIIR